MVSCTLRQSTLTRFAHVTEKIAPGGTSRQPCAEGNSAAIRGKSRASPSAAWMQLSSDTPSPDVVVVAHCATVVGSRRGEATYYNGLMRHGMKHHPAADSVAYRCHEETGVTNCTAPLSGLIWVEQLDSFGHYYLYNPSTAAARTTLTPLRAVSGRVRGLCQVVQGGE